MDLDTFLEERDLTRLKNKLIKLGVKKLDDMKYLDKDVIAKLDPNFIERKKLEELIDNMQAMKDNKISMGTAPGLAPTEFTQTIHSTVFESFPPQPPAPLVPAPRRKTFNFQSENGRQVHEILKLRCEEMSEQVLMDRLMSKDLKLLNQICYELRKNDPEAFETVEKYLLNFRESKDFFDVRVELTLSEKERIRQFGLNDAAMLSDELQVIESVIREYLLQYKLDAEEMSYYSGKQVKAISRLSQIMNNRHVIKINDYKKIYTHSYRWYLDELESNSERLSFYELFETIIHIAFYCIKCNLSLEDITRNLMPLTESGVPKTNHELFHLIFQQSDSLVRALCIENYCFSFPVPFCYPLLLPYITDVSLKFKISEELWFTFPKCLAVVSFGVGSAGCIPVGKSHLLDQIFGTDFSQTNDQRSAFHFQSIDVQFTKNMFTDGSGNSEADKFAFFDCHSCAPLWAIQRLCEYVNIIIIHVLEKDFLHNKEQFLKDLDNFYDSSKLIVIFIRDCNTHPSEFENIPDIIHFHVLTKNSPPEEIRYLKKFFREMLHREDERFILIEQSLVENILQDVNDGDYHVILDSRLKIEKLVEFIEKSRVEGNDDFLSLYPVFTDYMKNYNRASLETDQDEIDRLNAECARLFQQLQETSESPIVSLFLDIIDHKYSSLLLLKLSKYLTNFNANSSIEYYSEEGPQYQLSIDIIWREVLLSFKFCNRDSRAFELLNRRVNQCYSKQVLEGEPFELIDGDNLVFSSKDVDVLLRDYYERQSAFNFRNDMGKKLKLNGAPTVVSIFGPKSSGKSTLLNYCFGCKFVTSAGRCTKGVYGSLFQMKQIVNNSKVLLILDTEGSDSMVRGSSEKSTVKLDRILALFCLSVSQLVIINVKGDIGAELRRLLQACTYSLNRLKVNKVNLPRIFLVLNQQTDPDIGKHIDSLNLLIESLDATFYTAELEAIRVSDLIKITLDNLFVLPSAFHSNLMDDSPLSKGSSQIIKLSPTKQFVDKVSRLRTKIFEALTENIFAETQIFKNVSDWIQMAGLIWETCVKYQDIFRFSDLEEMAFSEIIYGHIHSFIEEELYQNQTFFQEKLEKILFEIAAVDDYCDPSILIVQKMEKFDEIFSPRKEKCENLFSAHFEKHPQSAKFNIVFEQAKMNLNRLIFIYRKSFEDKIKFRINHVLLELKISDGMRTFRDKIEYRIDDYINFSSDEKLEEFERIWSECYETQSFEDDCKVRDEHFEILYTNFQIECRFIEKSQSLFQLFRNNHFNMHRVISSMEQHILSRLKNSDDNDTEICFFCVLNQSYGDITKMVPYGFDSFSYLAPDSVIEPEETYLYFFRTRRSIRQWVPKECHPFVESCLGDLNNYEIIWGPCPEKFQILRLSSKLNDPNCPERSCWCTLIEQVKQETQACLDKDPRLSQTTIKILITNLIYIIKVVNHEIKYIRTMLSNKAERYLSTLVFSYAFQTYWKYQMEQRKVDKTQREGKKNGLKEYFFQTIANRKMIKGDWDTKNMQANDLQISTKFALDYLDSVRRYVLTIIETKIANTLEIRKETLTVEHLLMKVNDLVDEAINEDPNSEITDPNHFVVRFICDRNNFLEEIFHRDWSDIQTELMMEIEREAKECFEDFVNQLMEQFRLFLRHFEDIPEDMKKKNCFYSDYNFTIVISDDLKSFRAKETPFKAMATYLRKYLDPAISNEEMKNFFDNFEINGIRMVKSELSILPTEKFGPKLNAENFRRLINTNLFDSKLIFNIQSFISNFQKVLMSQLSTPSHDRNKVVEIFNQQRNEYLKGALGCKNQCPSCGKFCERGIHNDGSKCQIKTGHQLFSMGGKVWRNDRERTAILFMCDDYQDYMSVRLPGKSMKWNEFKVKCGKEWKWALPNDPDFKALQKYNREKMRKIWTKFGRGILKYYSRRGTEISFIPFSLKDLEYCFDDYFICFVIDGTGSMDVDIDKARQSVAKIGKLHEMKNKNSHFKIVIYRDHCDEDIIETFPPDSSFADYSDGVIDFLSKVVADGGGDGPEAMLDGLATAVLKSNWSEQLDRKNLIMHIFDAPPHGDFPNYKKHSEMSWSEHCCCCNKSTLCHYDWVPHVWDPMKQKNIHYHGISTGRSYPGFENTMKTQLGELCGEFKLCVKEQVDTAVMEVLLTLIND